jgi:CRISPR-associated protein Csc3
MEPLQAMARLAAERRIRGSSFKRNSLLKPLDIILDNLEREPKPDMRDVVRQASAQQIFDHMYRVAHSDYKPGETKLGYIREYVDLFFDDLLRQKHRDDVNRLLGRARLFRSAYLIYYADALPPRDRNQLEHDQATEGGAPLADSEE